MDQVGDKVVKIKNSPTGMVFELYAIFLPWKNV